MTTDNRGQFTHYTLSDSEPKPQLPIASFDFGTQSAAKQFASLPPTTLSYEDLIFLSATKTQNQRKSSWWYDFKASIQERDWEGAAQTLQAFCRARRAATVSAPIVYPGDLKNAIDFPIPNCNEFIHLKAQSVGKTKCSPRCILLLWQLDHRSLFNSGPSPMLQSRLPMASTLITAVVYFASSRKPDNYDALITDIEAQIKLDARVHQYFEWLKNHATSLSQLECFTGIAMSSWVRLGLGKSTPMAVDPISSAAATLTSLANFENGNPVDPFDHAADPNPNAFLPPGNMLPMMQMDGFHPPMVYMGGPWSPGAMQFVQPLVSPLQPSPEALAVAGQLNSSLKQTSALLNQLMPLLDELNSLVKPTLAARRHKKRSHDSTNGHS